VTANREELVRSEAFGVLVGLSVLSSDECRPLNESNSCGSKVVLPEGVEWG
jgi:hypothetical protein